MALQRESKMKPDQTAASALAVPVTEQDHQRGDAAASLTLVQYGDYQCPSSRRVYELIQELFEKEKRLHFVFRHFPLEKVHPQAVRAAQAAEAAAAQGKFWAMHDRLFRNQRRLEDADLVRHAERIGLDVRVFEEALMSGTHHERIRQDKRSGVQSGLRTTIALFLGGELHEGERRVAMAVRAVREQRA